MKFKALILSALLVAVALIVPVAAWALEMRAGEEVSITSDETISEDVYIAGGVVDISGLVQGDVTAAGGQIEIDGEVTADLLVVGGEVSISGVIGDDLRAAGGDMTISGEVSSNLAVAGGNIVIRESATVGGDALVAGGNVEIDGAVEGSLTVNGGNVVISGPVAGDVEVRAGVVEVGSDATIGGDLVYRAQREANIAEGAMIAGETEFTETTGGEVFASVVTGAIFKMLALLAGAMLIGLVFRRFTGDVATRAISNTWWRYLLLGFALIVLVPIAAVLLLATVIGIPLAIILLASYVAMLLMAWFYAAIVLGSAIMRWSTKDRDASVSWHSILVGAPIFVILGFVPVLGWIVQAGLFFIAVGSLGATEWSRLRAER